MKSYGKESPILLDNQLMAKLVFPEDGGRARKVVLRSNHGHVVKFASRKCGRTVQLESLLEYDRAILLEVDPEVVSFQEQPFVIEYWNGSKWRKIFPDFLVWRRDGSVTVEEVKVAFKAKREDFLLRCEIEKRLLRKHGYRFKVVTEVDIRTGNRLKNAKKLLRYRRLQAGPLTQQRIREALAAGPASLAGLCASVEGVTEDSVYSMLAKGVVQADLSVPLGSKTILRLPGK